MGPGRGAWVACSSFPEANPTIREPPFVPGDTTLHQIRAALAGRRPVRPEVPRGSTLAAVLLLLRRTPSGFDLLFTRRTQDVLTHKGQISFPGGSQEPGDRDLEATALRETEEELGIPATAVEILGELDDTFTSVSSFVVRPFVGLYRGSLEALRPAPQEVAEVLSVPLARLQDPRIRRVEPLDVEGRPWEFPSYRYGEHVIWGATARILQQFLALIPSYQD